MDSFKRICGLILKDPDLYDARISHVEKIAEQLERSHVPVSDDPCRCVCGYKGCSRADHCSTRTCTNPCELGHTDYPTRFNVDLTSEMLGSLKPYQRQVR